MEDLGVEFGAVRAVDAVSFTLAEGAALGLVGESGSGKSTVAAALLGLHRGTGARVTGSVRVGGVDVARAGEAELRRLRGGGCAAGSPRWSSRTRCPRSTRTTPSATRSPRCTAPTPEPRAGRHARVPSTCSTGSASRTPRGARVPGRTSSAAACGSAP
ncbi:hypothetical protein STRAU_6405 [Streptomyces aurantiacus JA 4570]|uniref:ABC transporter domain-containing protein n=1 Tax=Streptomyces aurantiacus JA 4570 TaxID=1286094 RepID=S3ZA18_9ACTN|nr:hypothetical protein STRAU_6405 [Streptomyces aurantiacus JA 4570]